MKPLHIKKREREKEKNKNEKESCGIKYQRNGDSKQSMGNE